MGFVAKEDEKLIGSIFFTRLQFDSPDDVFLLSPVAVCTEHQGRGTGQKLITSGIVYLQQAHAQLVFTYGDPGFYSKVGFKPVPPGFAPAPFALSQPEGWLYLSLDNSDIRSLNVTPRCVEDFNNPEYW